MENRTLRLRRETLVDLSADELSRVVGGTHDECLTIVAEKITHGGTSCDACPTVPLRDCIA